jgi:hypothetical protein
MLVPSGGEKQHLKKMKGGSWNIKRWKTTLPEPDNLQEIFVSKEGIMDMDIKRNWVLPG